MKQMMIIGNIGQDAVIQSWERDYSTFSVAVNERYKDKEGVTHDKTEWYSIISLNTKLAPYLRKGTRVFVQGKPTTSLYRSKSGDVRISREIRADKIELLGGGEIDNSRSAAPSSEQENTPLSKELLTQDDDELPF